MEPIAVPHQSLRNQGLVREHKKIEKEKDDGKDTNAYI